MSSENTIPEGMTVEYETVKKITYDDEVFYVINGVVYIHDRYGMRVVSGENQRVGSKQYTTEEYIVADPNAAISAQKQMRKEWDAMPG